MEQTFCGFFIIWQLPVRAILVRDNRTLLHQLGSILQVEFFPPLDLAARSVPGSTLPALEQRRKYMNIPFSSPLPASSWQENIVVGYFPRVNVMSHFFFSLFSVQKY